MVENKIDVLLSNFAYWESRKSYVLLVESFIGEEISADTFITEFLELWRFDRDRTNDKVVDHENVAELILELFYSCDIFAPDPTLREEYEIGEVELRDYAKQILLQLKNF
uniref:Colicin D immunity protein domain-containing protein n=1 Tax=Haptophyceae sp. NIES-3900 TaxID=2748608 RepID=A0A7R7AJP6_9EUKA|nr:hypothetical protein [Haptophyceae sp. NIES-3900]